MQLREMIVGCGLDIVSLERLEKTFQRFGKRFLAHFLSAAELEALTAEPAISHLGGRFAAKEAAVKALGTGFQAGITPQMIELRNSVLGQPILSMQGKALERARSLGASRFFVSISHERDYAAAMVILES